MKIEATLGPVTLTSVTGYFDRHYRVQTDYTNLVDATGAETVGPGLVPTGMSLSHTTVRIHYYNYQNEIFVEAASTKGGG